MNNQADTDLFRAIYSNDLEAVKLALRSGANLNAENAENDSPFESAAACAGIEIMDYLLEFLNIDPSQNVEEEKYNEVLHVAAAVGNKELVCYLIDKWHYDYDAIDESGDSVLDLAVDSEDYDLVKTLVENYEININNVAPRSFDDLENSNSKLAIFSCLVYRGLDISHCDHDSLDNLIIEQKDILRLNINISKAVYLNEFDEQITKQIVDNNHNKEFAVNQFRAKIKNCINDKELKSQFLSLITSSNIEKIIKSNNNSFEVANSFNMLSYQIGAINSIFEEYINALEKNAVIDYDQVIPELLAVLDSANNSDTDFIDDGC